MSVSQPVSIVLTDVSGHPYTITSTVAARAAGQMISQPLSAVLTDINGNPLVFPTSTGTGSIVYSSSPTIDSPTLTGTTNASTIDATAIQTVSLDITGALTDSTGSVGTLGQVLESTVTGIAWTTVATTPAWSSITNAAAALTLANANYATTFNQTSAVAWAWANTTAATSAAAIATIALVASGVTTQVTGVNSVTLTTTGATLLVALVVGNGTSNTATDSFGNTWQQASIAGQTPSGTCVSVLYAYANKSGGPLVTGAGHVINVASNIYCSGTVYAFSGTKTTSAVLGTTTAAGAANLASPISSCSITPATGDLLICGFGVNQVATGATISPNGDGNTWSSPLGIGTDALAQASFAAYTVAASATTSNPKWTKTGVTLANEAMVSFKPDVISVPQSSPILTLTGAYYGSGSAADSWTIQTVESATVNGPSTLTFAHTGSSGFAAVSFPNLSVTGQLAAGSLYMPGTSYLATIQTGTLTAVGQVITSSGTVTAPGLSVGGAGSSPGLFNAGQGLNITAGSFNFYNGNLAAYYAQIAPSAISLVSGCVLTWSSSSTSVQTSSDTGISRLGAASLAIGNGTAGDTTGKLTVGVGSAVAPSYLMGSTQSGLYYSSGNGIGIAYQGIGTALFYTNYMMLRSGSVAAWSSDATFAGASPDTGISRLGAASLAIGNGTAGNTTGQITATTFTVAASGAAPTSAGTAGTVGQIIANGGKLYFCSASGSAGSATWNTITLVPIL